MIKIWVLKVLMKTSGEKMKIPLGFVYFSFHGNHYTILYINCLVCLSRDSYAVGSAFSVAEPASV
jgi:hypothetical protein